MKGFLHRREGFWSQYNQVNDILPPAIENEKPWEGKQDFLDALEVIEQQARHKHYKGMSECRICEQRNGSGEFELDGWLWPDGYRHYIEEHNVRPSLAFHEWVLQHYVDE